MTRAGADLKYIWFAFVLIALASAELILAYHVLVAWNQAKLACLITFNALGCDGIAFYFLFKQMRKLRKTRGGA